MPQKKWKSQFLYLVAVLISAGALRYFVVSSILIKTNVMSPSLQLGDFVFVKKRWPRWYSFLEDVQTNISENSFSRGEILVYKTSTQGPEELSAGKVIGLPGEKIEIKNGRLFINDAINDAILDKPELFMKPRIVLPEECIVIDFQKNLWGIVAAQQIIGEARLIWFSKQGSQIRWDRTFRWL